MSAPGPGWYADPSGSADVRRWWDGAAWTRWLGHDPAAGPPEQPTPPPPTAPEHAGPPPTGPEHAGPPPAAPHPPSPAPQPAAPAPTGTPTTGPLPAAPALPHPSPGVRLPVAVALVVAALVVAVVAVGAVVSASAQRLPTGPALAPPPPGEAGAPAVVYDEATRTASIEELELVLPVEPYTCSPSPQPALPTFTSLMVCDAPVHPDHDADGSDWSATTGLGLVPDRLVTPGDLQATAAAVFTSLRSQFFAGQRTRVAEAVRQSWDGAPAGRAEALTAEIHYTVPGVPSRYDRTSVLVVELDSGGHGFWFSSRPDDTPEATLEALDASLAGMTAR